MGGRHFAPGTEKRSRLDRTPVTALILKTSEAENL
jgi:hypothetical protein